MDSTQFDRITARFGRTTAPQTTRRNLATGVVAIALALANAAESASPVSAAARRFTSVASEPLTGPEFRKKGRKGSGRKHGCHKNGDCGRPANPCEQKLCRARSCAKQTRKDGAACGDGKVCLAGQCGKTTPTCPAGETSCPGAGCVNLLTSFANCGACGIACDAAAADACLNGVCGCAGQCGACYEFVTEWGSPGTAPGEFDTPAGVAVVGDTVYVTDTLNNRLQTFQRDGTPSTEWGVLPQPWGIALAATPGHFYTTNSTNGSLVYVHQDGSDFTIIWEVNGAESGGPGAFNQILGVAVDSAGDVYAADSFNFRVAKYDASGAFLGQWGGESTGADAYLYPWGLASATVGDVIAVYVADWTNNRIRVFSADGNLVNEWGSEGNAPGQFQFPQGVATDAIGNVYVGDTGNNRVQKFTHDGDFVCQWGSAGSGPGEFNAPIGVAIDAEGSVFVTDSENDRIQVFGPVA